MISQTREPEDLYRKRSAETDTDKAVGVAAGSAVDDGGRVEYAVRKLHLARLKVASVRKRETVHHSPDVVIVGKRSEIGDAADD
jgi:hypothetical protein